MTTVTYRRTLSPTSDPGDLAIKDDGPTSIVWALGRLARNGMVLVSALLVAKTATRNQSCNKTVATITDNGVQPFLM